MSALVSSLFREWQIISSSFHLFTIEHAFPFFKENLCFVLDHSDHFYTDGLGCLWVTTKPKWIVQYLENERQSSLIQKWRVAPFPRIFLLFHWSKRATVAIFFMSELCACFNDICTITRFTLFVSCNPIVFCIQHCIFNKHKCLSSH